MKRIAMILGVMVLVGGLAAPVFAWGPGMMGGYGYGMGPGMMGYWGGGPGYAGAYGNLTAEQRNQLDTLSGKFYEETADVRNQIRAKSSELDSILNSANPDLERAKAIQKEINELRAKLDEKALNYEVAARKIVPQFRSDEAYASSGGYPMGGYGPGSCWN